MNKYIYRFIFICLAGISCLCSCSEKEDVGLVAYCGSYAVESVSWTGLPVDVNGDGVMSRDMLEELYGQPGFVPVYGFSLYSPFRLGFIGNQPFSTLFFCSNISSMLQRQEQPVTPSAVLAMLS